MPLDRHVGVEMVHREEDSVMPPTWTMGIFYFSLWVLWGVLGLYVAGQRGIGQRSGFLVGWLLGRSACRSWR
jgi:hypothetical protein